VQRPLLLAVGAVVFCTLLTLNSGGYRYGVSDQAFYIPVLLDQMTPELFPHDSELIAAQDTFFLFDDWFAWLVQLTGVSLPLAFLGGFLVTLALLYTAVVGMGRLLHRSWWTVGGFVVLMTARHQIPHTAVNSVESYFHPRMLAFAIGLSATTLFLAGRSRAALLVAVLALLAHPTTGLWFVLLLAAAAVVSDQPATKPLLAWGGAAAVGVVLALAVPLRDQLAPMDAMWRQVLEMKRYLVVPGWGVTAWLSNLAIAAFTFALYAYRHALGVASRREGALIAGCGVLFGLFLVSAPFSYAGIALAVQLQFNRIFWLLDVVGVAYLAWLLVESPLNTRPIHRVRRPVGVTGGRPRQAVVLVLLLLSLWRGGYRVLVERGGQPIVQVQLAETEWHDVMRWASMQPVGTHFLADPGHAGRYGVSVRAASGRDVYLELIKDTGIAIYSSDIAHRIAQRVSDIGDFEGLTAERARALARHYAIDFLITERPLDLPVAHRTGPFVVYDLGGAD
jgi:hypothetical protein